MPGVAEGTRGAMARVARAVVRRRDPLVDAQPVNPHHEQRCIINGEYRTCPRPPAQPASPRFDSDTLDGAEVRVAGYQGEIVLLSVGGNPNVIFWYRTSLCS